MSGIAQAQESASENVVATGRMHGPPTPVNFTDPETALEAEPVFGVHARSDVAQRFEGFGVTNDVTDAPRPDSYEVAITARGALDLSFAQRGRFGADNSGDIERQGTGQEVRVGQGLTNDRGNSRSSEPTWYVFAASDDEALTWNPGSRTDFGGRGARFSLQDRVEIGDIQAGVTYEQNGIQASIAYVEREVSTYAGVQSFSHDENFAGVTVTMRR